MGIRFKVRRKGGVAGGVNELTNKSRCDLDIGRDIANTRAQIIVNLFVLIVSDCDVKRNHQLIGPGSKAVELGKTL